MSMLGSQIDRLRTAAQTERALGNYELEQMLLDAADTITELRKDLEFANNEWEKDSIEFLNLQSENAKLKELVRWMYDRMDESCAVQYPYAPAPISCDRLMQAQARARELGIEADG